MALPKLEPPSNCRVSYGAPICCRIDFRPTFHLDCHKDIIPYQRNAPFWVSVITDMRIGRMNSVCRGVTEMSHTEESLVFRRNRELIRTSNELIKRTRELLQKSGQKSLHWKNNKTPKNRRSRTQIIIRSSASTLIVRLLAHLGVPVGYFHTSPHTGRCL